MMLCLRTKSFIAMVARGTLAHQFVLDSDIQYRFKDDTSWLNP